MVATAFSGGKCEEDAELALSGAGSIAVVTAVKAGIEVMCGVDAAELAAFDTMLTGARVNDGVSDPDADPEPPEYENGV